jgi:[acyl-carrier-protein] S-malonyltransferase
MSLERSQRHEAHVTPETLALRKIAYVFPPQGSYAVGMGKDLYDRLPAARRTFEEADQILGNTFSDIIFNGPDEVLEQTVNQQPAIFIVSEATRRVFAEQFPDLTPRLVAGASLGEYAALVAAGVLDFTSALQIVRERGRIMQEAGEKSPGSMASILGLTKEQIEEVLQTTEDVVISNENGPKLYVVSGLRSAVSNFIVAAKQHGAKRADQLKITIASHSQWMADAQYELTLELGKHTFRDPTIPIVQNVNGLPMHDAELIKRNLLDHLVKPVKWRDSLLTMHQAGIDTFIEMGPGKQLSALTSKNIQDTNLMVMHATDVI